MKQLNQIVGFCYDAVRPLLGSFFVCIYENQESCSAYAARQFKTTSWPRAFFKTFFRVLSCNPISGIILELKWRSFR